MKMKYILPMMMLAAMPLAADAQNKSGLVMSNLDKTAKPADDFYQFATGGWQKNNPLPAAYSRYGSFDQLAENNNKRINSILDELKKKTYKAGTIEQKLSDFYKLALDIDRRNQEGIAPVKPLLDEIAAAKTKADLQNLQVKYAMQGLGVGFGTGFGADEKNVTMNIYNVMQGGLTLGSKDYYLNNDAATIAIREAFKTYVAKMFQLYGFSAADAAKKAQKVFLHETSLATISKSRTELRDPQANYNKMSLKQFKENYPNIPLEALANGEGIKSEYIQEMIVGQPAFMAGYDKITAAEDAETLKALMEWSVIGSSSAYLTDEIREANFDFFGKTMSGRKEDHPLWKREKKMLGYSVQDVKADALNTTGDPSVTGALDGKVAGLQMNTSSTGLGGSTKITIRGNSSLTDNNQPLWVVDGVPFTDNQSSDASAYGGYDRGGTSLDINPEDIESISVLKGANAAALYGSRAGNGVILITTKSGKRGTNGTITVDAKWGSNSKAVPEYKTINNPALSFRRTSLPRLRCGGGSDRRCRRSASPTARRVWEETAWSITLAAGEPMKHTAKRAVSTV